MSKKNVYLSAGHSGENENGVITQWLNERGEAMFLCKLIKEKSRQLVGLRLSSEGYSLKQRIAEANAYCGVASGYAVEIHFNAGGGTGCESVIADAASDASRKLAARLADEVSQCLGLCNRGVRTEAQTGRKRVGFVRQTTCPAVLFEVCFADNEADVKAYNENLGSLAVTLAKIFDTL